MADDDLVNGNDISKFAKNIMKDVTVKELDIFNKIRPDCDLLRSLYMKNSMKNTERLKCGNVRKKGWKTKKETETTLRCVTKVDIVMSSGIANPIINFLYSHERT